MLEVLKGRKNTYCCIRRHTSCFRPDGLMLVKHKVGTFISLKVLEVKGCVDDYDPS